MTDRVEPVYNIEVANDHCYRVGVSLAAVPASERLAFLSDLSKQLETVADGEQIEIDV